MSLRVRLLAAFAYVLVLAIVALELPLALNLSRRVDAEVKGEANSAAQLVADSAAGRLGRARELQELLDTAAHDLGGRVIITDRAAASWPTPPGPACAAPTTAAARRSRPRSRVALRRGRATASHSARTFCSRPCRSCADGRAVGAVRVTQSVEEVQAEVRERHRCADRHRRGRPAARPGVAWILAGSIARPLRGLAGTARSISAGNLDERADEEGSKEQQDVAAAFNDMTGRLAHASSPSATSWPTPPTSCALR